MKREYFIPKEYHMRRHILMLLTVFFVSSLVLASCTSFYIKQPQQKQRTPDMTANKATTWVIYIEGYGGRDRYEKQNKSRLVKVTVDGKKR
jgi:uncharacterized alpha/beta hydrolase family protein